MNELIEITSVEDYKNAIKNKCIMIFSTQWCPDCHFMKTYINDIINENKDYIFYYVDRDKMIDLCIDLGILGIPSFVAYNQGKEIGRFVSKLRKTKEEVQMFINGCE